MIIRILVSTRHESQREHWMREARSLGLADLEVRKAYYFETDEPIPEPQLGQLEHYLADPVLESASARDAVEAANQVWVAYKRGIVDNESDSLIGLCALIGVKARAAKVATVYVSSDCGLRAVVEKRFYNPNIDELHTAEPVYDTLLPFGRYTPMETFDLRGLSEGQLADLGLANGRNLNLRQMRQIRDIQLATGAPYVTDVLLEALDARWSDHCYHTTWKSLGHLLKRLMRASRQTSNPNALSMFTDNAGVWDFYDGMAIALKGETHNGPSAISAYFGQLTKLGGVLRDILGAGLGADPVGSFEYTATGVPGAPAPLKDRPDPRQIAVETIRAIKEYGNTFGVPMMWSRMCFHPAYRAKPFALGGSIGMVPVEAGRKGSPQAGDLLLVIGGLTGNDGIHGASASSAGAVMDEAAVQIGSPLEEVKFSTAILELRDHGCIRAITDVGGAGLNSAVGEIGDPCGVWLNTALVPLKTAGLPMWRILLSESQERMVLAIKPSHLNQARQILRKHEVRHTVVGKFTGQGRYTVIFDPAVTEERVVDADPAAMPLSGEVGIDAPYSMLSYEPEPLPPPPVPTPTIQPTRWPDYSVAELPELLKELLADVEVCDQSLADNQYDSTVQGHLTYGPYSGAARPVPTDYWAAALIPERPYAALFATAFDPWLFDIHPVLALRQDFLRILGKFVLAGSRLRDIALCDNFYTPHLSGDANAWLVGMVEELEALILRFGTPVISGKDSSAGSVRTPEGVIHVPPAVFLSGIGKVPRFDDLLRNDWRGEGSVLVQIGPACLSAAGTVAQRALQVPGSDADLLDVEAFSEYLRCLESCSREGWLSGCSIGAGGILAAVFRRSISSGLGVELEVPAEGLWWLLAEHRCGALLEVTPSAAARLPAALSPRVAGRTKAPPAGISIASREILTAEAVDAWATRFERWLQ